MIKMNVIKGVHQESVANVCWSGVTEKKWITSGLKWHWREHLYSLLGGERGQFLLIFLKTWHLEYLSKLIYLILLLVFLLFTTKFNSKKWPIISNNPIKFKLSKNTSLLIKKMNLTHLKHISLIHITCSF